MKPPALFAQKEPMKRVKKKPINYKRRHKRISGFEIFRRAVLVIFCLFILGGLATILVYKKFVKDLPDLALLEQYRPPIITRVYDRNARIIGELFEERRILIPAEDMPALLKNAFMAIEDKRFFQHHGVDYKAIIAALVADIRGLEIGRGASTISMQVARNFFLSRERTLSRKIKEAILATRIERNFSKQEIFYLYLNQIYLGHGAYGVGAAAEIYFGKKVGALSIAECALLAALPKAPAHYDPYRNPQDALERRNVVLKEMLDQGMISSSEYETAKSQPIKLVYHDEFKQKASEYFVEYVRQYLMDQYGEDAVYREGLNVFTTADGDWNKAAYKAMLDGLRRQDRLLGWRGPARHLEPAEHDAYLKQAESEYSKAPDVGDIVEAMVTGAPNTEEAVATLKIGKFTARLPAKDAKWIKKLNMEPFEEIKGAPKPRSKLEQGDIVKVKVLSSDPDGTLVVGIEQDPLVQGAVITIDPFTGEILAMVGGRDFEESEFNRAMQARRQPGSAFKPIVYTAAIDAGYTPATVIVDTPIILQGPNGPWKPRNFDGEFSGPRTVASALQHSVNTISVRLIKDIGVDMVVNYARKMGITSPLNRDLSLGLGTASITLYELVRAYGVLATEGKLVPPVAVRRVYDRNGRMLENRVPHIEGYPAAPENMEGFKTWCANGGEPLWGETGLAYRTAVAQTRGQDVLSPDTSYVMISMMLNVVEGGTGTNARIPGMEIAGKTGTTSDFKDALFVGFNSVCVTGVWMGNDNYNLSLGRGTTGGDVAAPIWQNYMYRVLQGHTVLPFPRPEGTTIYYFDFIRGTMPGPTQENAGKAAFKPGTQPAPYEPPPDQNPDLFQNDYKPQDNPPNEGGGEGTSPKTPPVQPGPEEGLQ